MSVLRNVLFTLLVVLALAGGVWAYLKLREIKKPSDDALERLPANCSVYLYTQNLFELNNRLNTRSLIIDRFAELSPLSNFLPALERFCEVAAENTEIEETFSDNGVHFAYYPENNHWLISFNLKELGQERSFQTAFSESFSTKKLDTDRYSFEIGAVGVLFMKYHNGGVCISNSKLGIEDAYNTGSPKLKKDSAFIVCSSEFDETELLSVYFNHQLIAQTNQGIRINALQKTGYSSGQLDIQPSQLVFNGQLHPGNNSLFEKLLQQNPSAPALELMLPDNCVAFKAYGFQEYQTLINDGNTVKTNQHFWDSVNDSAITEISSAFYKNITTTLCEFKVNNSAKPLITAELSDTLIANEHLDYMHDSIILLGGHTIYRIFSQSETPRLFEPFSSLHCAFAFVFDGYLYFAEELNDAISLLQSLEQGHTFEKNPTLMAYAKDQFPESFSVLHYVSPSAQPHSIKDFYPAASQLKDEAFEGLRHNSLSLIALDRVFKLRWHCALENEKEENGEQFLWTLKLDTICTMVPQKFTNHLNGEQELVVQDEGNTLYLINSKGKILWKKALNEKITSQLYLVDMFRNGKFQMLFSSANYLHLIDRNSNYIESYPVKTPGKLSSPLCVFDYEGSRDYRLFFACTNKKIYNYTIYGLRNEKFSAVKTEEEVELPIQYIKVGESDYLLSIDKEGKVYAFSRRGELRLRLSNRTLVPCREVYVDATKSLQSTKLNFVDETSGGIHRISLSDKKEILDLQDEETVFCYRFGLVDENRNMDLVLAGSERISAYNLNGTRLFETNSPIELSEVDFYTDQNHSVFYGWSKGSHEFYLYDSRKNEGRKLKSDAMPLFCDLFKNNKIYLVYPENNQINCLAY